MYSLNQPTLERRSFSTPTHFTVFIQVMTRHRINPGDAEEKRHSCHRVNRVTLDSAHHCVAPERHRPPACYQKR